MYQVDDLAEVMSTDRGRDQVVLAAQAGTDVAFLIGSATVVGTARNRISSSVL